MGPEVRPHHRVTPQKAAPGLLPCEAEGVIVAYHLHKVYCDELRLFGRYFKVKLRLSHCFFGQRSLDIVRTDSRSPLLENRGIWRNRCADQLALLYREFDGFNAKYRLHPPYLGQCLLDSVRCGAKHRPTTRGCSKVYDEAGTARTRQLEKHTNRNHMRSRTTYILVHITNRTIQH